MFSATGLVAALAVLALTVNVVTTSDQPPGVGSGTEYAVAADGSGDYATITEAVEAAADGDTIMIRPGTYAESIIIDKDITVIGDPDDPRAVVVAIPEDGPRADWPRGQQIQYAFWLRAASADLGHLTIHGPGRNVSAFVVEGGEPVIHDVVEELDEYRTWPYGFLYIHGDGGGTIRDNITKAFFWLEGSTAPTITGNDINNAIRNDATSAAHIENNQFGGIWIQAQAAPTITGNVIDYLSNGGADGGFSSCAVEMMARNTRPTVVSNVIKNAPTGICLGVGVPEELSDNELVDNNVGMSVSSSDAEIGDNLISGGSTGISIYSGSPRLTGNTVEGAAKVGVVIGGPSSATLSGNKVCGSEANLVVGEGATPAIDDTNEICEDAPAA